MAGYGVVVLVVSCMAVVDVGEKILSYKCRKVSAMLFETICMSKQRVYSAQIVNPDTACP